MKKIYLAPSCSMEVLKSTDIMTDSLQSELDNYDIIVDVNNHSGFWG